MACQKKDVTHIFVVQSKGRSCFLEHMGSEKLMRIDAFSQFRWSTMYQTVELSSNQSSQERFSFHEKSDIPISDLFDN